jgi:hypothetical protein
MKRLLDLEPEQRKRFHTGADLVPVVEQRCPCGTGMDREVIRQDALLRGGGYGGTKRVETDVCSECGTTRVVAVATERPPR